MEGKYKRKRCEQLASMLSLHYSFFMVIVKCKAKKLSVGWLMLDLYLALHRIWIIFKTYALQTYDRSFKNLFSSSFASGWGQIRTQTTLLDDIKVQIFSLVEINVENKMLRILWLNIFFQARNNRNGGKPNHRVHVAVGRD